MDNADKNSDELFFFPFRLRYGIIHICGWVWESSGQVALMTLTLLNLSVDLCFSQPEDTMPGSSHNWITKLGQEVL